ncbi:glucuronyl esterase domain-containing protein [Cohnella sp. 56]|uniref:glucuronyl esterase domain-containing protein n=1 Tax=Cohnella sp. 56 TaxID=3113722 RepID=UPI0030E873EA
MTKERGLPDVLVTQGGERIGTADDWREKRRPEIMDLFREHVYGREPVGRPASQTFHTAVTTDVMAGAAVRKQVEIRFEGAGGAGRIRLLLYLPSDRRGPSPVLLLLNNRGALAGDEPDAGDTPFWPADRIVARGYAAAVLDVEEVDPDFDDGFRNGVHGLFDRFEGEERPADAWATIAAWAWGAGRAMDYFESDPDIDASRVAVVGHSRGGKAALWAGAVDERFAFVVSNESGCTGAAISRGKRGETIRDINAQFPHWFSANYHAFAGREEELPVDQHMLVAAIAPRPVYVASATEDEWADPSAEFASLIHAAPVYRLYGYRGLQDAPFPDPDTPLFGERMGYHLRTGVHDLTVYDWDRFMDFADNGPFRNI